jgi:hypothetical protein
MVFILLAIYFMPSDLGGISKTFEFYCYRYINIFFGRGLAPALWIDLS